MEITVRNAKAADLPAILEIVNYSILNSTANYNYTAQDIEDQEKWFAEKQSKDFPVIVARDKDSVIGFATYGTFREKTGYRFTVEHSVYVTQNYIGKGIGKLLLEHLIALAKAEGYHTMIGVIDAENEGSIAFHEKFGFTTTGTIREVAYKFDRWLDLVFMQLLL